MTRQNKTRSTWIDPREVARRTKWLLLRGWPWLIVLAVGIYLFQRVHPSIELQKTGRQAPDFTLPTMNGETFQLSEHRGEVVVLNVWATWCPPCRVEIPGFIELQDELQDEGVQFVGLSVDKDGFAVVRPFARKNEMNYPQLANSRVANAKYGGTAIPRTYLIDKQGRIRYTHAGLLLKGALEPALRELAAE